MLMTQAEHVFLNTNEHARAADQIETRVASVDEVKAILKRTRKEVQPVLDYLKDK